MSIGCIISIFLLLLWAIMAASTFYVCFFALASRLPRRNERNVRNERDERNVRNERDGAFLILFPAYQEDRVIKNSVEHFLRQTYPHTLFKLVVISDHMQPETNAALATLPITLLQPVFENSSKAKALQHAIHEVEGPFDHVVVLDADNIVDEDFLERLNTICQQGYQAVQCHRCAKNVDSDVAALDGLSEEINNSIFRLGHNRLGLSSALIGSGMCFGYNWFRSNVDLLNSTVEDRELEVLLMQQNIYIHYAEDLPVKDEKVSTDATFQRQRLRWMSGQLQTLLLMLPHVPLAIATGNINYLDKTLQQALIPRSLLLLLLSFLSVLSAFLSWRLALLYLLQLAVLSASIVVAIPKSLRTAALASRLVSFPRMALHMLFNMAHLRPKDTNFIHTPHKSN